MLGWTIEFLTLFSCPFLYYIYEQHFVFYKSNYRGSNSDLSVVSAHELSVFPGFVGIAGVFSAELDSGDLRASRPPGESSDPRTLYISLLDNSEQRVWRVLSAS